MGTPLRGELTRPSSLSSLGHPDMDENIEQVQGLLSQVVRLSSTSPSLPSIIVSSLAADDSTAPWSWTAADVVSTETALLPYLVHLAAAKDDADGISFGLASSATSSHMDNTVDIVNCLDVGGRSPLHTAALHNSVECVDLLLKNGALVHLRDILGHTPLYYVCVSYLYRLHVVNLFLYRPLGWDIKTSWIYLFARERIWEDQMSKEASSILQSRKLVS
jgi:60kDa lysophospholipase